MSLKIKSSAKVKRRYLFISGSDKESIEKTILDYLGILGWSKAKPLFVEISDKGIILAVERSSVNDVRAAFEMVDRGKIERVSGTLDSLKKSFNENFN